MPIIWQGHRDFAMPQVLSGSPLKCFTYKRLHAPKGRDYTGAGRHPNLIFNPFWRLCHKLLLFRELWRFSLCEICANLENKWS